MYISVSEHVGVYAYFYFKVFLFLKCVHFLPEYSQVPRGEDYKIMTLPNHFSLQQCCLRPPFPV